MAAALNSWTAGVTLVTVADGRDDVGATVSAFCPVSEDPPLVMVSLLAGSYPAEVFGRAEEPVTRFAVIAAPAAGQRVLSGRFAAAGRPGARLMVDDVPHRRGEVSGALIVEGGLAALECSAEQVLPAGDHLLVLARVTSVPYVTDAGRAAHPFPPSLSPLGSSLSLEEPDARFRHQRPAHRPRLRLLAGRQGQLRRRPGTRRADPAGLPEPGVLRTRQPRVPGPHGPVPGRGGGDPAVPRHRHRHPDRQQHPRGRPAHRAGQPDRLRRQRPDRAVPRPGAAEEQPAGCVRLP